jgi:hypothetical protein
MAMKLQFVGFVPNTNCTTWLLEDQTYVGTIYFDIVDNDFTAMPFDFWSQMCEAGISVTM